MYNTFFIKPAPVLPVALVNACVVLYVTNLTLGAILDNDFLALAI